MADFQFYLNTQGLRGRSGLKGDAGFSPVITIGQNTLNTFTLMITTHDGTFETPNLRGSIINNAGAGTYLRHDAETDSIYLSELQTASETQLGGVTIATEDELANAAGTGVITADNMGAGIYGALRAGDNVALTLDEETGLVTISSTYTKYTLPVATTGTLGGVKPDGTTITITDDGTISSVGGSETVELPVPRIGLTEVNVVNKPYNGFTRSSDILTATMGVTGGKQNGANLVTYTGSLIGEYKTDTKNGAIYFPIYLDIPIKKGSATIFPEVLNRNWNNRLNTIVLGKKMGDGYFKPILTIGAEFNTDAASAMHNLSANAGIDVHGYPFIRIEGVALNPETISNYLDMTVVPNEQCLVEWVDGLIRATRLYKGTLSQQQGYEISTDLISNVDDIDTIRAYNFSNVDSVDITQIRQLETGGQLITDSILNAVYPTGKQLTLDETSYKAWDVLLDNQTIQVNAEGQLAVNMDEIGGDVSALSARVTTLEETVSTMETTITDMHGTIETLTNRVTALETEINGGNA